MFSCAGESPTVTLDDLEPLLQRLQLQDTEDDNTVQVRVCTHFCTLRTQAYNFPSSGARK